MKPTIAVLGTGLMGAALVRALLKQDFNVLAWNRTRSKAEPLANDGAHVVDSAIEAVDGANVILVNVTNYDASKELLRNTDMTQRLSGKTVIELTSGTPSDARDAAEWAEANGFNYLDGALLATPDVIGTEEAAIAGAGPDGVFADASDVMHAMAPSFLVGSDAGQANALDIAGLSMMWGALFGAIHSVAVCRTEGVDLSTLIELQGSMGPVINHLVGDFLKRNADARFEQDEETLATVATHYHALHHLVDVMDARGLDRSVVDGYLALFGKAKAADKLTADFSTMSHFMNTSA